MKNKLKTNKGITLIALIVTIVVLLILAVVSINLAINEGFIFKTKDATIKHKVAEIDETLKLILNDEQICRSTRKKNSEGNYELADETPYTDIIEMLRQEPVFVLGSMYDKATGETIAKNLLFFLTDLIYNKDGVLWEIPEEFKYKFINIEIDIGNNSYRNAALEYAGQHNKLPTKDIFAVDEDYNLYYIDEEGNIYTGKTKYEADKIYIGAFNPDSLPEEDKNAYYKIYDEAKFFTNDEEYAKKISELFIQDPPELFMAGGFGTFVVADTTGETILEINGEKLENLALLILYPEGRYGEVEVSYYYLMDSKYNLYKCEQQENGTATITYRENNDKKTIEIGAIDGPITDQNEKEYNGYKYMERFDKKNLCISDIPDTTIVDMKKDLAGLNVYTITNNFSKKKNIETLILPETLKTLSLLRIGRQMVDNGGFIETGMFFNATSLKYIEIPDSIEYIYIRTFKNCTNLETVIMPDNIKQIGQNAFAGCNNVTLKFKGGIAPSGAPWGGTNIKIESK